MEGEIIDLIVVLEAASMGRQPRDPYRTQHASEMAGSVGARGTPRFQ